MDLIGETYSVSESIFPAADESSVVHTGKFQKGFH